jgi:hypothetical protein
MYNVVLKVDASTAHHSFYAGELFELVQEFTDSKNRELVQIKDGIREIIINKNEVEFLN